ncbi:hypothetical protein N657DRAFT_565391 [Parathielavia appendiculata]|uniref:Ubiquitin-conjugating enzyme E2-binding protein n=1 Tax=Parathielavia appendiculata TaxID=2587402 RepID=A0AAN6U6B9_9PEZI|nr:hypothetical protein N657DRAFT_565391 [Parathielavia appendiculata]
MGPSDECLLYAELLANIRQISLAASLPTPCDASTQLALSADGQTVQLKHGRSSFHLTLPAKASLGAKLLPIQDQQKGRTSLAWRLPLDATSLSTSHQADPVPWSATDLDPSSGVACRQCRAVVVPSGAVKSWKDLPSENWAEMMEFWHCHKPDHKHRTDHGEESGEADDRTLAARGYGASSAISAQEGVGFVDLTTLLLAESDCQNVTLGFFDFRAVALTLLKWQIACASASCVAPGIPECLAATIVSTISRCGAAKSLITPLPETIRAGEEHGVARGAIHIWVLNSSIVYSSNGTSRITPAIKLLYRPISRGEAHKMLEEINCDAQEINLPAQAIGKVVHHLEESNALLPPTERLFKEWRVGLLTRWEFKA